MLEDCSVCDDENALEVVQQQLAQNLIMNVGIGQSDPKDILDFKKMAPETYDLITNLDYPSLENLTKGQKIKNATLYNELFISSNLVELVRLREKFLHCLWERHQLHKIYKFQWRYIGNQKKKYEGIYSPFPFEYARALRR